MTGVPLYKVLVNGSSCHGGDLVWPLPTRNDDGSWTPGGWIEVDGPLVMCENGLHLTRGPAGWYTPGASVYRAEYEGEILDDDESDKVCVRRVRLLAEGDWTDHQVYLQGEHVVTGGTVTASGSATVTASGSASVTASGSARVRAYDSATVTASGSATVTAYGSATVTASGSATVTASGSARVRAYDSATVTAYGSATVTAYDSATVTAYDSATVTAYDSATVISSPYHRPSAEVALSQLAAHIDRRDGGLVLRSAAVEDGAP